MTKPDNDTRPQADEVFRGWLAIATFLGVSATKARTISQWGREHRCPVFEDHIGPVARRSELERWMRDAVLPTGVRARMRAPGRVA